ncbi:PhoH-like ATPase [Dysgonomonas sp. PFB1-18]|uniref:PhoH family protein n=1 Tax=unclassified Dysgonomonas TaxID=2630389 RepID=UPI002473DA8A|nr:MULTISPECIES: PhoH family protein [unclassified Dysgonomonas]MDH6308608.1 PhoH-like ATPase [Dysgonomonas sp. PF1-14]MDH6338109.1 PhoH-like ATPase [Dysgonomonas sp. PF1-16]MDH6379606.1 PhoH-like ATPase [Dysgonomonas sp. PFB1-18]MDH6396936.1 PhoH-like ATPase [Dysgonomonas sp. PF1-23]
MARKKKKNFVLDTNVILHDFRCLDNFEENDVYLPIVVLEELDKFKKGNDQINYNAREFLRQLDVITDDNLFTNGTPLGSGMGNLFVATGIKDQERVYAMFPERIPDHRILSAVMEISERDPKTKTILVTKDINLRMKARAIGLSAEDYINDKVADVFLFEKQHTTFSNMDSAVIDALYASPDGIPFDEFDLVTPVNPNECFIMKNGRKSVLARYNPFTNKICRIEKQTCYGIQPRNAEQTFAFEVLMDPDIKLAALTGKAGTGKTLLALASALKQSEDYNQVLLARPIVALGNKELGFLPGDEKQKIAPYMQPLFDNLAVIKSHIPYGGAESRNIEQMQTEKRLEIEALAYIRGRSLSEMICIIDEAQNLTPHEIKTIITRAGEGTKMIFAGDLQQIDSPYLDAQSNGLAYMIDKMTGQDLFAHVNLVKGERSKLSEIASTLL